MDSDTPVYRYIVPFAAGAVIATAPAASLWAGIAGAVGVAIGLALYAAVAYGHTTPQDGDAP
jgi:hypothetical protein